MEEFTSTWFLTTTLLAIGTGALSAYITAKLSFHGEIKQRLWEIKREAYTNITNALFDCYDMNRVCRIRDEGQKMNHPREKEVRERFEKADLALERTRLIGAFVISKEAVAVLEQMEKDKPGAMEWQEWPSEEFYSTMEILYKKTLEKFSEAANRELNP